MLSGLAEILVPNGRLCVKVVNGSAILAGFRGSERVEHEGVTVTISRTLTLAPPRMTEKIAVTGLRGSGQYMRRQRLYRSDEICGMLERAGFSVVSVLADCDGAPFESTISKTMWLIGERKQAL